MAKFRDTVLWLTALILACWGCGRLGSTPTATPGADQAEIEAFIDAALPADAADVHLASQTGIDRIVYIRFEASASTTDTFLDELNLTDKLRAGYNPFPPQSTVGLGWWQTDTAHDYRGGSYIGANGKAYEILIEQVDPDRRRVYLRVYEL